MFERNLKKLRLIKKNFKKKKSHRNGKKKQRNHRTIKFSCCSRTGKNNYLSRSVIFRKSQLEAIIHLNTRKEIIIKNLEELKIEKRKKKKKKNIVSFFI